MQDHMTTIHDVAIRPSPIHGLGVFTTRRRPAGEVVTVLDGQVVPHGDDLGFLLKYEWNAVSDAAVMLRPVWTTYGFINHARPALLSFRLYDRALITTRDVEAGTELTLDYCEHGMPSVYLRSDHGRYLA